MTFLLALYSFFFSPSSPFFYRRDYADFSASSSPLSSSSSSSSSSGFTSSSRFAHPSVHHAAHNPAYAPSGWGGDALKNRVFFAFMFVEAVSWFWAWVTLQEERREVLARKAARRRSSGSIHHNHGY